MCVCLLIHVHCSRVGRALVFVDVSASFSQLLIQAMAMCRPGINQYPDIALEAYGPRMARLVAVLNRITLFGVCSIMFILIGRRLHLMATRSSPLSPLSVFQNANALSRSHKFTLSCSAVVCWWAPRHFLFKFWLSTLINCLLTFVPSVCAKCCSRVCVCVFPLIDVLAMIPVVCCAIAGQMTMMVDDLSFHEWILVFAAILIPISWIKRYREMSPLSVLGSVS